MNNNIQSELKKKQSEIMDHLYAIELIANDAFALCDNDEEYRVAVNRLDVCTGKIHSLLAQRKALRWASENEVESQEVKPQNST